MFSWRRSWRNKHTPNHLPGTRFPHVLCVFLSALLLLQLLSAFIFAVTCKSVSKDLMQSRCSFFLIHSDNFKLCSSWLIAHSLSELHRSAILGCHFTDTCDAAIGIHPRHHAREHKLNQAVTYSREVNSTWWKTSSCLSQLCDGRVTCPGWTIFQWIMNFQMLVDQFQLFPIPAWWIHS